MSRWQDLLHFELLGNPALNWGLALITFLVTLTVLPLVKGFIAARRRGERTGDRLQVYTAIDLATLLAARTSRLFLFVIALYLASRHLTYPPTVERIVTVVIVCIFWLQVGLW